MTQNKGRFQKGHIPWNSGLKGTYSLPNQNETSFKAGKAHPSYRPIGSERLDKDGYLVIKIADRKWMLKHRYLWCQNHGEIPKGHIVMFKDGDKTNVVIDNLMLVSRQELAVFNKSYKKTNNSELNEAMLLTIRLEQKLNKIKKPSRQ